MSQCSNLTDAELLGISLAYRKSLIGQASGEGCCLLVAAPLATLLQSSYGVACEVVISDHAALDTPFTDHVWIKLADGRALDPTYSQFPGTEGELVYLGAPTEYHQLH